MLDIKKIWSVFQECVNWKKFRIVNKFYSKPFVKQVKHKAGD